MKDNTLKLALLCQVLFAATFCCTCFAQAVPFAENGSLKMLYDNRMYPQAVEDRGKVYIVWRGEKGLPYILSYDLDTRDFSEPFMLLTGMEDMIDAKKYASDHHYAPVLWIDFKGYLHVVFGCHNTPGTHLISSRPRDMKRWGNLGPLYGMASYPKVHQVYDNKTLVYFRHGGHLGAWKYRLSSDGGRTWDDPKTYVTDLNMRPRDGFLAEHAGSYHTTEMSEDGKTLHVSFIWKVEDPVLNSRYNDLLHDYTQRYNLYYLKIDLPSGRAYNYDGKELELPVRKKEADADCLVWDTQERVAAVGPSICLDDNGLPNLLLPVSEETPYKCRFYFVRRMNGQWQKTPITRTAHPFNASHLERNDDGTFKAYLITGQGENISEEEMDQYGWGDRVEEWVSDQNGENWKLSRDITPQKGHKYQNIKFISQGAKGTAKNMLLFYSWQDAHGPGTAYIWDNRK